ncbi:MAG: type II toxin-antitoxin system ParD family antitoxin [Agrobacterium cavarae]|uniref:ribbon-helix-helix domain-containing protein n=1 Tax=unclassified Agrobacterium TaxID=2632611 RepID=UPI000DE154AA|nr:type II toxin-antitoxin system ParD family antitoxin [Agrobacterium sp. CNPSo 3708]MDD1500616.1 type II toxin-antitoxin system ParD family antitoxin [Agrobacterium sp. CNPSo 3708]
MPVLTVSISPEQAAKMHEAVACGAYASSSEVVRAALKLWAETQQRNKGGFVERRKSDSEAVNVAELYAFHNTHRR